MAAWIDELASVLNARAARDGRAAQPEEPESTQEADGAAGYFAELVAVFSGHWKELASKAPEAMKGAELNTSVPDVMFATIHQSALTFRLYRGAREPKLLVAELGKPGAHHETPENFVVPAGQLSRHYLRRLVAAASE